MRIAAIDTELASASLAQKLADSGWTVTVRADRPGRIVLEWEDGQREAVRLAEQLTAFVLTDWLYEYIQTRVGMRHPYLEMDQREYVTLLVLHGLRHKPDSPWESCRSRLQHGMLVALGGGRSGPAHVSVDGVVRFRARRLLVGIDPAIDETVHQMQTDQEYEEFVSMLRYILDAQPASQQVIHVFCSDERIWLCDAEGNLVRDNEVSTAAVQVSDGEEVNPEDLAMSILITRAPCRIVLHDLHRNAPWPTFAETVTRVFQERVRRCEDCSTCQQLRSHLDDPLFSWGDVPMAMPDPYD
ncbi:sporulation protein YtxC [Alicyclobacillus sp.]|uniref:sporulation protein YtxC n=1 Tax=Alicyclobacillus sp. TaxID=61169 RepID=UPI0025C06528|nr:sporulation protein YtxC [Alicyclobacillus sp.]MCL6516049.1 putative sporulation protein YtxC [Alicyclobacillus sp.]